MGPIRSLNILQEGVRKMTSTHPPRFELLKNRGQDLTETGRKILERERGSLIQDQLNRKLILNNNLKEHRP